MTNATAGAHARAGHDDGSAANVVQRHGLGSFPREVQSRQAERITSALKQFLGGGLETLGMPSEYLGSRYRHGQIEEHLCRFREPPVANTVAQEIEKLLCPLHGECGNDDISPTFECRRYSSKSSSMDGPECLCARSPYVVSITTLSAWGGLAGLRNGRRPALPRSPENSTLVERPCSESCRKMLAEPRI